MGGDFDQVNDQFGFPISGQKYLIAYNPSDSSLVNLNGSVNNVCRTITINSGNVYVGGDFTTAGGSGANRIASWNGSSWTSYASGLNNSVYDIDLSGSVIYATGSFTASGATTLGRYAQFESSSWTGDYRYATAQQTPPPSPPTPPPAPTSSGSAIINLPFIFDLSAQSIEIFGEEVTVPDASFNLTTDLSLNAFLSSFLFKDNESGDMDISFVETSALKNHINLLNSTTNAKTLQLVSVDGQGGPNYTQFSKVGSSFTPQNSSICNHFLQYVASLLFGHPQAQAPIKNDAAILADLSGDDLGRQFVTELSNNHVVRHSMLEQLIDADVSNTRFDYSHNDTYHSYPFLDGDKIVFRVKMQGNLFVDAISTLSNNTSVSQSTISALFSNITGIDAQDGKVSERIWKVTATLRQ
jgi:hypothetical protein